MGRRDAAMSGLCLPQINSAEKNQRSQQKATTQQLLPLSLSQHHHRTKSQRVTVELDAAVGHVRRQPHGQQTLAARFAAVDTQFNDQVDIITSRPKQQINKTYAAPMIPGYLADQRTDCRATPASSNSSSSKKSANAFRRAMNWTVPDDIRQGSAEAVMGVLNNAVQHKKLSEAVKQMWKPEQLSIITDRAKERVKRNQVDYLSPDRCASIAPLIWCMLLDDNQFIYKGTYKGLEEYWEHWRKKRENVHQRNQFAFNKDIAGELDAMISAISNDATTHLASVQKCVGNQVAKQSFRASVVELRYSRAVFLPPLEIVQRHERLKVVEKARDAWDINKSIFAARRNETDSHCVYDNEKSQAAQQMMDWKRVAKKQRFRKMVGRTDLANVDREMSEIFGELSSRAEHLRSIFNHYSMVGTSKTCPGFVMSLKQWMIFHVKTLSEGEIVMKGSDMMNIFIATNFEEEKGTQEADENDEDELLRFEFLEALVRLSFTRFILTKEMEDASDAVGRMLKYICQRIPKGITESPNVFRKQKLYNRQMEIVFKDHWPFLQAMYKLALAKARAKYYVADIWVGMLEELNLINECTGIDRFTARIVFYRGQMPVIDEIKRRQRSVSATMFDFIEILARLAGALNVPPIEQAFQQVSFSQKLAETEGSISRTVGYTYEESVEDDSTLEAALLKSYEKIRFAPMQALGQAVKTSSSGPMYDILWLGTLYDQYYQLSGSGTNTLDLENTLCDDQPIHLQLSKLLSIMYVRYKQAWGGSDVISLSDNMMRAAQTLNKGVR